METKYLKINPADNVVVAISDLKAGETITVDGHVITLKEDVPAGHKVTLKDFAQGENIIKYGYGYCGYLGIAVVVVPFLTVGVYKNRKYIREHGYEKGFAATQPETEAAEAAAPAAVPAAAK
mgnify:CR=1 FL=1